MTSLLSSISAIDVPISNFYYTICDLYPGVHYDNTMLLVLHGIKYSLRSTALLYDTL
jgi:hypothetical protein